MITIYLCAFADTALALVLMRQASAQTKRLLLAVIFLIPLALAVWVLYVGDQMPEGTIRLEPTRSASP